MRVRRVLIPIVVLGGCVVAVAGAATRPNNPFRSNRRAPATRPRPVAAPVHPIVSNDGLENLHEVFLDPHLAGEAKWLASVGMDYKKLREFSVARLKKLPGLKITTNRSVMAPRLLVQVQGHAIQHYDEKDPPAATHMTVALMQPVLLARRAASGPPLQSNGMTYHATVFSTGKLSSMPGRVKDKVGYLLDGFVKDYQKANPR